MYRQSPVAPVLKTSAFFIPWIHIDIPRLYRPLKDCLWGVSTAAIMCNGTHYLLSLILTKIYSRALRTIRIMSLTRKNESNLYILSVRLAHRNVQNKG